MKKELFVRSFVLWSVIFVTCIGCQASGKKELQRLLASQKEVGYGKVMSDSIASIIFGAKNVQCFLPSESMADSARVDTIACVSTCLRNTLVCIFFNEQNFQGNDTVYGRFKPWATYKFKINRKRVVYLELDFSLSKWRLLDNNKREICAQDTRDGNMELLYLTRLIFADDKTLKLLNENLKYTKK